MSADGTLFAGLSVLMNGMGTKPYAPSLIEAKCLQHLDAPGAWELLRVPKPAIAEGVSWRPFRLVFFFNFGLFATLLFLIFIGLEYGAGVSSSDVRADLPVGCAIVLGIAAGFGGYSAHLYRRSWNRRAKAVREELGGEVSE